jgi:pilus assembly protein Flp/PilA
LHFSTREEQAMQRFIQRAQRFVRSDDGPTAIEYAVMLGVIIAVCLIAINAVGTKTNTVFSTAAISMGS